MGNANSVTQSLYEKYIRPNSSQQTTSPKVKTNQSKSVNSNTPVTDQLVEKYIKKTGSGSNSTQPDTVVPKSVLLPTVAGNTSSRGANLMQTVKEEVSNPTSGGYYSRPEVGQRSQWAIENVKQAENAMVQPRSVLDAAGSFLEKERTQLNTAWAAVQNARTAFEADPTQEMVKAYNETVTAYNSVYDRYNNAYSAYESAYAAYKTSEDKYKEAVSLYETEVGAEQAKLDAWRRSVRDEQTIQSEMEAVQGELSELYKGQRLTQFNDWAGTLAANMIAGSSGLPVQTQMGMNAGKDPRIRELEQRLKDLEEEYAWSKELKGEEDLQQWQGKYTGKTYDQLTDAMEKLPKDSPEYEYLRQYAPTVMTAADYNKQIPELTLEIKQLKEDRDAFTDATQWYQTYVQNGGDPDDPHIQNDERMIAYRKMVQQYGDLNKLDAELEEKQRTKWEFVNSRRYGSLGKNADYEEQSTAATEEPTTKFGLQIGNHFIGTGDPVYDYINDIGGQRTQGKQTGGNAAMRKYDHMSEEEVANYNYLYNTEGKEAAGEYLKYLEADLDKRNQEELVKQYQQLAQENPAAASALSVPANLLGGLGYLDIAAQRAVKGVKEAITGEYSGPINYNRSTTNPTVMSQTMRETVSKKIEDSGAWGEVGSFAYQTGMSMADFLLTSAASGGSSALSLAIMGTGAASSGTLSAIERGLSDDQAFALGTIQGLAEVLSERFSVEALLDMTSLGKNAVGYVIQNVLTEGLEEGTSTLINTMADVLISKDKSQWEESIQAYMQKGMTEQEAFWHAAGDQAIAIGLDMLGGAISGGAMGGGSVVVNTAGATRLGAELGRMGLTDADVQTFIEEGLEAPVDSRARYLAQQMQEKLERGEALSDYDIGRLYQANIAEFGGEAEKENTPQAAGKDAQSQIVQNWSGGQTAQTEAVQTNGGTVENVSLPKLEGTNAQTVQTADAGQTIVNGGIQNANEAESAARVIAAESGAAEQRGTGVPDGSSKRIDGQSTGEQAGVLASRTGETEVRKPLIEQRRAVIDRQNRIGSLRLEKVSSIELGIQAGTEAKNITLVPQEHWDGEMQQLADRIYQETGKNVSFVMGAIQIKGVDGKVRNASGVINGEKIVVRADHLRLTTDQLADHEAYHSKSDFAKGRLHEEIRNRIIERFGEEKFHQVLTKYMEAMRGVYDSGGHLTGEEFEQWVRQVEEEVFADAYAGINAFGAGATQFTDAVNERMSELNMGKIQDQTQENGVRETNGPPTLERYSVEKEIEEGQNGDTSYEGKSLINDPLVYTYSFLTAQPDMQIVTLPPVPNVRNADGKIDPSVIAEKGINNARSVGTERDGRVYVRNSYTNRELWVTESAIRHGLSGDMNRVLTNARLGAVVGEIVQNAIPINALYDTAKNVEGTYAMAGYATDDRGREFVVIVTVEQRTSSVSEVNAYDLTHALSGRQKRSKQVDTESQGVNPSMLASKISIADLLDSVKATYRSILSEDVLTKYDEKKNSDGYYAGRTRYSVDTGYSGENFADIQAELDASNRQWSEMFLQDRLGVDGAEKYRQWQKQQAEQKKQQDREKDKKRRVDEQQMRKAVADRILHTKDEKPSKVTKPVAESRPIIAKKDLRDSLTSLFSIPAGQRATLGQMIDGYADRLLKNGSLTEDDRKALFDRMYDAGVMEVPTDEYFSTGRNIVQGGRIYVPQSIKDEFGDDWESVRKRAFVNGIYLVNDKSASGIDQWNSVLAEELAGLFDAEDTDLRMILERIVQLAEEGRDNKLSLAEYTAMLAEREYVSESEFLDNMERRMDEALRTFAKEANLEIKLRDRTGIQIAKERQRGQQRLAMERLKEAEERELRREKTQRAKEQKELRAIQEKTLKTLQWLSKNRNRAPEDLRAAFDEVLGDIDLYAIGAANEMRWSDKHNTTWKDLAKMYKAAKETDPNFTPSDELQMIVDRLDGEKIGDMDIDALNNLYKAAIGLRTEFHNRNNVINDELQRLFAEVYTDSKQDIQSAPGETKDGFFDKLMNSEQLTPMNMMQRMVGWNPDSAFYSMAKQLEKGERDIRAYTVKAQQMLTEFLTDNADWVKRADGQGKDAIWYEIEVPELLELHMGDKPIFGDTVTVYMTPAQKVHMFLESKNYDNLRHMEGGRTFADKDLYSKGKRQEAFAKGRTIRLAPETVKKITADLTQEEMELARLLEQYYNSFAKTEINRISNVLYGYDKALGKNYAPIYTNRNYTKSEFGVFEQTAEGVGNLKERVKSKNPSYNIGAFDAFERHVDQTARFVGMAVPARNWTTLMNWQERGNSMKDVLDHKWGSGAQKYISDLIETLQAGKGEKSDVLSSLGGKLQSNYISAIFGSNPSIVLKQLGSIPLASAYLDVKNVPTPKQISSIDRSLISKYTKELDWRLMGYATPETKQLKENPNWTQTNRFYKFTFGGGSITAMDGWAASVLWPWAENKVRRDYPDIEIGTQEQINKGESPFYKKVAELFNDAVSRSQSVSDETHQGTLRKSKGLFARAFTMFRSDSAQTYNTIRQKIGEAQYYMRSGEKGAILKSAKKAVGSAFVAMLMNAMWSEAISFLMAMWKNKGKQYRDEEDELTAGSVFGEMVKNVLGSIAGVVTGGEEIFEVIGNVLTGEKIYDIEAPGIEQLNDFITAVTDGLGGMRDVFAGAVEIARNNGDLGKYFTGKTEEILDSVKVLAETAGMYIAGLPVSNVEAYLTGTLKWISPELGAAYDDMFAQLDKKGLAGSEGKVLESRVGRILSDRDISESDETAATIAALYEAGYKDSIPGDLPDSCTIDGEKYSLDAVQQQMYGTAWSGIVGQYLDEIIESTEFVNADTTTQAKMLKTLYDYASAQAKYSLFEKAGPYARAEDIEAALGTGLSMAEYLEAYSKYSELNSSEEKAANNALEFANWVDQHGYTNTEAELLKNRMVFYNFSPAKATQYEKLTDAGLTTNDAFELAEDLADLQPENGRTTVEDIQRWRTCIDFSSNTSMQMAALCSVMKENQYHKVKIANDFGVTPDAYVALNEILPRFDADGSGGYKQEEIEAAIDSMGSAYTREQKAVLWQLTTTSKSSKNNPYSTSVGQKVLDAKSVDNEMGVSFEDAITSQW